MPKDFRQRRPDGHGGWIYKLDDPTASPPVTTRRVLYRLPQLLDRPEDAPVYICEGEKDADALAALGLAATCNPGGAGKWRAEYGESLRDADVVVIADADEPGRKHAAQVRTQLDGVAASVRVLELPGARDGRNGFEFGNVKNVKDASEWLAAGGTLEELERLVSEVPSSAPMITPIPAPPLYRSLAELLADPSLLQPPTIVADRFAWRGRVTLLAGREKSGKSTLSAFLVASVSRDRPGVM